MVEDFYVPQIGDQFLYNGGSLVHKVSYVEEMQYSTDNDDEYIQFSDERGTWWYTDRGENSQFRWLEKLPGDGMW